MSQPVSPPRTWVRFGVETSGELPPGVTRVDRYRVNAIQRVTGAAIGGVEVGALLVRVESSAPFDTDAGPFIGVTQHLVYAHAHERRELLRVSAPESGPLAVLIPIRKTDSWWALAQDERDALLRPAPGSGHIAIGARFASRIYRKLYHARYAGGSEWDFLTYFEFPAECSDDFRDLLQALRDPASNPEWAYVERESELWMTRL